MLLLGFRNEISNHSFLKLLYSFVDFEVICRAGWFKTRNHSDGVFFWISKDNFKYKIGLFVNCCVTLISCHIMRYIIYCLAMKPIINQTRIAIHVCYTWIIHNGGSSTVHTRVFTSMRPFSTFTNKLIPSIAKMFMQWPLHFLFEVVNTTSFLINNHYFNLIRIQQFWTICLGKYWKC